MSKQIYIDSNGNEIQVSGTVNTADMMPMSGNDSTKVSEAIGDLSQLTTTDKSSIVGAVNEVNSVETKILATNATYYKTSKVVQVSLVGYSVPANTGGYSSRHIIGYLPVGYRPIVNAYAPYISDNIKSLMIGASNGEVSIRNSSGSAEDAYVSITFLTN